ncbi:hypothetical protein KAU33_02520 [Candidatus Dependentiae bacterium]|nr:hypothetical protein [Candidatus Dependentiae bacterium]
METLESIMEKFETDATLFAQEDYDEIEAIAENIIGFLDKNPEIDKKSFMMGFTVANINAMNELMKEYKNDSIQPPEKEVKNLIHEEKKCDDDDDDFELKEGENAWPLRG